MFDLIYRDGTPINAGHYEGLKTDGTEYKLGQAVSLENGVAKKCGGATNTKKVYGIVAEAASAADDTVLVLKVEKDMIFKTRISGDASHIQAIYTGMKLAIGAEDYASAVAAAATLGDDNVGVTVANALEASADGDLIEVRFEN